MNWKSFYDKAVNGIAFSDGSMGVFLQKYGLKGEDCPELWNITHDDIIYKVHRSYVEAGSDLLITNTLGGNRVKLADYKLENRLVEINAAAVKVARKASAGKAIVAGDVGPTGLFIEPLGQTTFDEMAEIYREQCLALADAGADCIFFETHIDILELKAGIIGCRQACDLPIIASVTFEKDGRTVTGSTPEAVFTTLEALGVDIIGTNCGTGPDDMSRIIERTAGLFSAPLIVQANAGMPRLVDGKTVFDETPESYVKSAMNMVTCGVNVIGGCCGTTPDHIKMLHDAALDYSRKNKRKEYKYKDLKLSSRYLMKLVGFGRPFTVIGERLNPTARKLLSQDILSGNFSLFKDDALAQENAGADILDMNMGIPGADEKALIKKGIEILSTTVKLPIAIDSSDPEAARIGMKIYPGKGVLNSISAEGDRLKLLKDVKKYGSAFIALPIDGNGIPKKAEDRVRLMRKIIAETKKAGIDPSNIIADPLVLTVSAEQDGAKETLKTVRMFKEELGLYTTMGLSNVSFGLPARGFVNRSFLSMAIENGLTTAIVNPLDADLMGTVRASDVLLEKDVHSKNYIDVYANLVIGNTTVTSGAQSGAKQDQQNKENRSLTLEEKLKEAVIKGKKETIEGLVREALAKGMKAFDILNDHLIPGITEVGALYEKRTYFLPQLMQSAETMKTAFLVLEPLLKKDSSEPAGRIVFATVQGDVHDIGKNIVILLMKNYGYEVIDLGKDVPNETVLSAVIREKPDVVALSALMTTTMPRMEEFVKLLRAKGLKTPVMVGGAAVTRTYAESIGAQYSTDAVEAVRVAKGLMKK
jgi:5-methyltetrahydrofolate--homocysteine methyltransferase